MDKKQLLRQSLANLLKKSLPSINNAILRYSGGEIQFKLDKSPVTQLDLELSRIIEEEIYPFYPEYTFYSEENFNQFKLPLFAVDPLDGTKEFISGRNEWVISVGLIQDQHFNGEGWIYNPRTLEIVDDSIFKYEFLKKENYTGEVSRSEWSEGMYSSKETALFQMKPLGSIAYKLARLAAQKSDFVISLKPKNIWDVAAGTILCQKAGLAFYSEGKRVTSVKELYQPPLIWCHEELFLQLSETFS